LIKGWAIGDGKLGTAIERVEVSFDGEKTWKEAEITHKEKKKGKVFSWVLWEFKL